MCIFVVEAPAEWLSWFLCYGVVELVPLLYWSFRSQDEVSRATPAARVFSSQSARVSMASQISSEKIESWMEDSAAQQLTFQHRREVRNYFLMD